LQDLQATRGFSYLFIAHDLAMVRHIASRVAVTYLGCVVETGPKRLVYSALQPPGAGGLRAGAIILGEVASGRSGACHFALPNPFRPTA